MMIEELQEIIAELKNTLFEIKDHLSIDAKILREKELQMLTADPGFWASTEKSAPVILEMKAIKATVEPWKKAFADFEDMETLYQLAYEEKDESLLAEISDKVAPMKKRLRALELSTFLSGETDANSAYIMIHSGAGGTEACDWAEMLFRMYSRWVDKKGYKFSLIDLQQGEEAGIKSVTAWVEGPYAYGYLKSERGVHRLVRISPFDSNQRRHTSFASVDVAPEVSDEINITVEEKDLRIDTYRASGAGGQHVNKTDSAVRITHIPTNIVVQCQNERSQHKNRAIAMKLLRSRLYELELEKREVEAAKARGLKKKIEWGSQIRSYVFHPYTLVKDLRTDYETSNGDKIMDGEIDDFIEAYLKMK